MSKLAKMVGDKRVIIESQTEVEGIAKDFFFKLFQGHHRAGDVIEDTPFQPDFTNLALFTDGLPRLSFQNGQNLVSPITLEEIKSEIKESPFNKSPGLDGLTHEFYKKTEESLLPTLVEVFNM